MRTLKPKEAGLLYPGGQWWTQNSNPRWNICGYLPSSKQRSTLSDDPTSCNPNEKRPSLSASFSSFWASFSLKPLLQFPSPLASSLAMRPFSHISYMPFRNIVSHKTSCAATCISLAPPSTLFCVISYKCITVISLSRLYQSSQVIFHESKRLYIFLTMIFQKSAFEALGSLSDDVFF